YSRSRVRDPPSFPTRRSSDLGPKPRFLARCAAREPSPWTAPGRQLSLENSFHSVRGRGEWTPVHPHRASATGYLQDRENEVGGANDRRSSRDRHGSPPSSYSSAYSFQRS